MIKLYKVKTFASCRISDEVFACVEKVLQPILQVFFLATSKMKIELKRRYSEIVKMILWRIVNLRNYTRAAA